MVLARLWHLEGWVKCWSAVLEELQKTQQIRLFLEFVYVLLFQLMEFT